MPDTRQCQRCWIEKPLDEEHFHRNGGGWEWSCVDCRDLDPFAPTREALERRDPDRPAREADIARMLRKRRARGIL